MSTGSISQWVLRHKGLVALVWLVIAVAGIAGSGPAAGALSERFDLPGSESSDADAAIVAQYGTGAFSPPIVLVSSLPSGVTVDSTGVQAELQAAYDAVVAVSPELRMATLLNTGDRAFVSDDGATVFALAYPAPSYADTAPPELDEIRTALRGVTVQGEPVQVTGIAALSSGAEAGAGEEDASVLIETLVGGLGALVVLIWVFGSFLALVPLLMAAIAIVTCYLLVWALTGVMDVSFIVQFLIALIGLGVAIDYSLLVVTRWREERAHGLDNEAAVQRAMETAGHAVVFSGTTVAIGLLALVVLPVPFLRSIGVGGMLIPLVSVAVSITLLPVLLAKVGPFMDRPRWRSGEQVSKPWARWTGGVVRRRWVALGASLALLVILLIPALRLELGSPRPDALTGSGAARDALLDLEAAGIEDGVLWPFEVFTTGVDPSAVAAALREVDGIRAAVTVADPTWQNGESAIVAVLPEPYGDSNAGREVLDGVRDAAADLDGTVLVGGGAAGGADFVDAVYRSFPLMLGLITLVTFVLLARAFRSLLLPIKALVLNALTVGAAYGLMVLVWQMGYGSDLLFGLPETGAISAWVPIMAFSFLYGLSMDYEVFILARVREEYDASGSTDEALVRGISRTGRLVTAAAVILFLAFVSLSAIPETEVKIMATTMAIGILLDATIVRALLLPATVSLMGKWNWWLPSWLERFAPPSVEGGPSLSPGRAAD
jgi:RND superfamily putative drug exporter